MELLEGGGKKTPVGYKISKLINKGYPHKQAVAIALNLERRGKLGPRGGYRRSSEHTTGEISGGCWQGYERVPGKKEFSRGSCRKSRRQSRRRSRRLKAGSICTSGRNKKFARIVNGKCIRFGDPNMTIKKNQPGRKRSFCARHRCSHKKNKATPGYQSCKKWSCQTGSSPSC